jgi:hypothetical protein
MHAPGDDVQKRGFAASRRAENAMKPAWNCFARRAAKNIPSAFAFAHGVLDGVPP